MSESKTNKRLIIVDVSNFIFRAFYAIRMLHSPEGVPVNAVYGVFNMLLKLLSQHRPTHILLARDTSGGTFRNELYKLYKANRSAPPEDLVPQFALIGELIKHMGMPEASHQNYEADDIIGTACVQWADQFDEILIASGDKDLMQFVNKRIKILDTMKDKIYDEQAVFEKMGVRPDQIVDYLSMVGDSSDNVPGMKGIGAKGAAKLLAEYDTLDQCFIVKDTFKGKKLIDAFGNHAEDGILSKKLIEIVTDVKMGLEVEDTKYNFYPSASLLKFLDHLGFKSGVKKLEEMQRQEAIAQQSDREIEETPLQRERQKIVSNTICKQIDLDGLLEKISAVSNVALHTEYSCEDMFERGILSVGICLDGEVTYVIPFHRHSELNGEGLFREIFGREDMLIYCEHGKRDVTYCLVRGIELKATFFDIVQAHYVLDAESKHDVEYLAQSLSLEINSLDKKNPFVSALDENEEIEFVTQRVHAIYHLAKKFAVDLVEKKLMHVYQTIDGPMINVLARMEHRGVLVNLAHFKEMEEDLEERISEITKLVAGHSVNEVNLNSPKQVGAFLFDELALPVIKNTKTGPSTDSEVLEELSARNISAVPQMILKYRELGKIQSTYVKAIPQLINPHDGKIHTHFNQHITGTGRLSSLNPNIQNIPIRSNEGRRVRKGFVATPGNLLLSADYSQVELRLLAHFSEDPTMIASFNNGIDIHIQTASEVAGISIDEVTSEERSRAKAVNFGLMYGQSSFGLGKALKISRGEAKAYIDTYFERFGSVKGYLDSLKEKAEKYGYAETYYGRRRYLPDIHSANRNIKANAERVAINSPIQGTAADIIKLAMINIEKRIKLENLLSKMIIQVHDELIFDVPEDELVVMKKLVREEMEGVVQLKVPFKVDMGYGVNWYDLK